MEDPKPGAVLRRAYRMAVRDADGPPTLFDVTTALEDVAVRLYGAGTQGHTPGWQAGLNRIGLGTTGDVRRMLHTLAMEVSE